MFRPEYNRESSEGRRIVNVAELMNDVIHKAESQSERMYAQTRYRDPDWTEQNQLPDVVDYSDYATKLSAIDQAVSADEEATLEEKLDANAAVAEGIYEEYASFMFHVNNLKAAAKQLLARIG